MDADEWSEPGEVDDTYIDPLDRLIDGLSFQNLPLSQNERALLEANVPWLIDTDDPRVPSDLKARAKALDWSNPTQCRSLIFEMQELTAVLRQVRDRDRKAGYQRLLDESELLEAVEAEARKIEIQTQARQLVETRNGGAFKVMSYDELKASFSKWLIRGLLPYGLGFLVGNSGYGKSFVALDLTLSIRTGTPWFGVEVEQRNVLLVLGEGESGYTERIDAWCQYHGMDVDEVKEHVYFITEAHLISLTQQAELSKLVRDLDIGFVLIDTLSTTFGIDDENNNALLSNVMRQLKKALTNTAVMVVHHPTGSSEESDKPKLRGATAIHYNAEYVYTLTKHRANEVSYDLLRLSCDQEFKGKIKNAAPRTFTNLTLTECGPSLVLTVEDGVTTSKTATQARVAKLLVDGMTKEDYAAAAGVKSTQAFKDLTKYAEKITGTKPQQWKHKED
jgi:hypothetical protein